MPLEKHIKIPALANFRRQRIYRSNKHANLWENKRGMEKSWKNLQLSYLVKLGNEEVDRQHQTILTLTTWALFIRQADFRSV